MNIRKHTTVAKGYRLAPETHQAIKQIRSELKYSQDRLISEAIKLFHKEIYLNKKMLTNK